jgi:hypothetical protein
VRTVTYRIDVARRLVTVRSHGPTSWATFLAALADALATPAFAQDYRVLYDRRGSGAPPTPAEVDGLTRVIGAHRHGRWALVLSPTLDDAIGGLALSDAIFEATGFQVRTFLSVDDACAWLGIEG